GVFPQLVFTAAFVGTLFVAPRLTARRILRALTKAGDGDVTYRFDPEGGTIRASGSTTSFAYRARTKAREGKTAFLLYPNPLVANIVPKRAFSAEGMERVRSYITANVPTKRTPRVAKIFLIWIALIVGFVVLWQFLNTGGR